MRLALVGAGNVADRYAAAIGAEPELELAGATISTAPARRRSSPSTAAARTPTWTPCSTTTASTPSST